ncbi:hypothetical protein JYT28_00500 [Desulfobulbus sp. AH-315-M07]|nr:hypothetical protein [Desulfobulbus sp. AH-315-M07]
MVACSLALSLTVGCSEEERETRDRFGSGGGGATQSSTVTSASQSGSGGLGDAGGLGGAGGSITPGTQEACFDTGVTVSDLMLTQGDPEFNGNGPVVNVTVELTATPTLLTVQACVDMKETKSDFTTAVGCAEVTLMVANAGVVSDTKFAAEYTDTDHDSDNVISEATSLDPAAGLVKSVQCVGDTAGNDICAATNSDCSMCLFNLGCVLVTEP